MEEMRLKNNKCQFGHHHSSWNDLKECEEMRSRQHCEIEELRQKRTYTCSLGHSHSSVEELNACHNNKLQSEYLERFAKLPSGDVAKGFPALLPAKTRYLIEYPK
ncbi:uncharacterized protein LOC117315924 [Pecten maximus]|uniref:uncharacterized protein LOC117315924 n=1 Tax=Pecten maximus TaxID=6579 RepID=UPI0014581515|nr:uncharacterized protein LOC117315924 [Pecten maximus]